jgi:topoisomerase IA-like protein
MDRIIKTDPITGTQIKMKQGRYGDTVIEQSQTFDNLLKINKHMADDWRYGQLTGTQKHMAHVAEIPNVLYNELVQKFGKPADNPKAWKQWLNSNENRVFRTGGGHL